MIVDDANFVGLGLGPTKYDPPLLVDPNAVEASPIASQGLQAVSRRRPEIGESMCGVQHIELSLGHRCNIGRKPADPPCAGAVVKVSGGSVAERGNHLEPKLPYSRYPSNHVSGRLTTGGRRRGHTERGNIHRLIECCAEQTLDQRAADPRADRQRQIQRKPQQGRHVERPLADPLDAGLMGERGIASMNRSVQGVTRRCNSSLTESVSREHRDAHHGNDGGLVLAL